jgi:hypothetical protein
MVRLTTVGEFDMDRTMVATYFTLRWATVAMAAAFPPLMVIGGWWHGCPLENSLSAYYATPMRDWFVGILFAVAACLYVYKGLSDRESNLLNAAAVLSVATAVTPFDWRPDWPLKFPPHDIYAVSFFLMIALACWLCQDDSLNLGLIPPDEVKRYRMKYTLTGIALAVLPALAAALNLAARQPYAVITVETAAIWVFAFYWYTKSGELQTAVERQVRKHRERPR